MAARQLEKTLRQNGEIEFYEAAKENLDKRIEALKSSGFPLDKKVADLRTIRKRVSEVGHIRINICIHSLLMLSCISFCLIFVH